MNGTYVAEPDFRGLQFAGRFAGATMIPLDFDPGPVNATAYAARLPTGQIHGCDHQQGSKEHRAAQPRRLQPRPRPHRACHSTAAR